MSRYPSLHLSSVLSRLCLLLAAFALFCGEKPEPDQIEKGKARLIYVPQNKGDAAFIWTAFDEDLQSGDSTLSEKQMDELLVKEAPNMLKIPAEFGCEISVEEIRREKPPGADRTEIHVEYFAFCEKSPETLTIAFKDFFPLLRTTELYYKRKGQRELTDVPGTGIVQLKKPEI